jgi:hypothetical protein
MHLPKLQNWILQHADPDHGADWPCLDTNPNRLMPLLQHKDPLILKMKGIQQCVPCLLKAFLNDYCGNVDIAHNQPLVFHHDKQASLSALFKMAHRWFCRLPGSKRTSESQMQSVTTGPCR